MKSQKNKMKTDKKIIRDFNKRDKEEQEWIIENNYCDNCKKADTGLNFPIEYEYQGKIYVDGVCKVCGSSCSTEISETQ